MLQTATKTKSNLKELEEYLLNLDLESPEFEGFMAEIIKKYKQKKQKEEFEKWSETLPVMKLTPEQEKELEEAILDSQKNPGKVYSSASEMLEDILQDDE